MIFEITYRLFYTNESVTKIVKVSKAIDKEHALRAFNIWSRRKFSSAIRMGILSCIPKDKDITLEGLKIMFNMN